jgi:hypothetical protein
MSRTDHRRSHVLDAKWICKWREQERPTNVRTAEVDAAGAVEVVDAEEVRVVRPASAAQEVDHVDPPHLAPASSSCCPLVRVHDAPPSLTSRYRRPAAATTRRTIQGNKEIAPIIKPDACQHLHPIFVPYLNRIDRSWIGDGDATGSLIFARGQEGRAKREAGAACMSRRRDFSTGGSNRQRRASLGSKCWRGIGGRGRIQ